MPWDDTARAYRFPFPVVFASKDCVRAEARRKTLIQDREEFLAAQKAVSDRELARFMSAAAKEALSRVKALEYVMHWHVRPFQAIEANPTIAPMIDEEFRFLECGA